MSGLRSQREYTMTCVSLRSGMGSSGAVRIDQTPATTASATSTNTTKRFLAENSMTASIMAVPRVLRRRRCARRSHAAGRRLQLVVRIDRECAGRDDPLASRQALHDRHAIAEACAGDDGTRLEVAVA